MKRFFSLILFGLVFLNLAAKVKIEKMTANEIILNYSLSDSEYNIKTVDYSGEKFSSIEGKFDGSTSKEGFPKLPFVSELIGIPVNGSLSYSILSKEKITKKLKYEPVPNQKMLYYNNQQSYKTVKNPKAYNQIVYPSQIVRIGNSAFMGLSHYSSINIYPFQYNPKNKELVLFKNIKIRIIINGDKTPSKNWKEENSRNYDYAGNLFINEKFSRKWFKERKKTNQTSNDRYAANYVNTIQFVVGKEGIYKIDYSYLMDSLNVLKDSLKFNWDFDWNTVNPKYFELSDKNGPIPIYFYGEEDGSFDPGDYFEFYGDINHGTTCYYNEYTSENIYSLKLVDHIGSRMAIENGGLTVSDPAKYYIPTAYKQKVHFEQQNDMQRLGHSADIPREDLWFWRYVVGATMISVPFELEYPKDSGIDTYDVDACLFGITYPKDPIPEYDHHAIIRINTALIDDKTWYRQNQQMFSSHNELPNSFLNHGENDFYISLPGDTPMDNEKVALDYFDINYWREYKTDKDYLKFTKPQDRPFGLYQFQLYNFSSDDVSVYKLGSSVMENLQITSFSSNGAPYSIAFQDSVVSDNIQYFAVTESHKMKPLKIQVDIPSDLKSQDNSADYVIITIPDFVNDEGTQLLKQTWENEGHSVQIVSTQDIYDEFNHGLRSAQAIKDFIDYAYNNWGFPHLNYVELLGDGLSDERDNSVYRDINLIPFKNIWTWKYGATPSDNWYACLVGDDTVPDICLGRINVWKEDQIMPVVEKIIHNLHSPNYNDMWHSHVTLTAGGKASDETDIFATQSETIRRYFIPKDYVVSRVYTTTQTVSPEYHGGTFTLKDNINDGTVFLQFMGHGGGHIWADYNLFNYSDVETLTNSDYPIVASLACYASAFDTPRGECLGEALVLTPDKGAVATIGFTGLGYLYDDLYFGESLSESIFQKRYETVGEALRYTLGKFYSIMSPGAASRIALTQGCALIGDPLSPIHLPKVDLQVNLNKYNFAEGDTVKISADLDSSVHGVKIVISDELEITQNIPYEIPVVNGQFTYNYVIPHNEDQSIYIRFVKVLAYSDSKEYIGISNFTIGKSAFVDQKIYPQNPVETDSVRVTIKCFDENGVQNVVCKRFIGGNNYVDYNMVWNADSLYYQTVNCFPPMNTGATVYYKFELTDNNNETHLSDQYSYQINGPELDISDMSFEYHNYQPTIKVMVQNIGNSKSKACDIKLYRQVPDTKTKNSKHYEIIYDGMMDVLQPLERKWFYLDLPISQGNYQLKAEVNHDNYFNESNVLNNVIYHNFTFNQFELGEQASEMISADSNLVVTTPNGLLMENAVFELNTINNLQAINQPDAHPIKLNNGRLNNFYEIKTIRTDLLADSLGHFPNDGKITLTYYYDATDSLTNYLATNGDFAIYRWQPGFSKWVRKGGNISLENHKFVAEVNQTGIYGLFNNTDKIKPSIDVNVQDQEFTYGGYVSSDGVISFIFSDANGIDLFDNDVKIYINGDKVDKSKYSTVSIPGHLTNIPVKYQLDLTPGTYTLMCSCVDVDGNYNSSEINFEVNRKFEMKNVANYPNPVVYKTIDSINRGRTRFTYVLTDDADRVYMKIYTVGGRLIKTFEHLPSSVGYHEFPRTVLGWDCRDDNGFYLANGVYFYKIIAVKNNKSYEKINKMAILK